ncbi:hypothetical protein ACFYXF_33075 [Streptomyces sp. NPDC002680]|uniref:hypothetical protein n=1 Tax=Streptomyces sp. NPDC002680 TaxID=3364659 RepID=UPI0036760B1B
MSEARGHCPLRSHIQLNRQPPLALHASLLGREDVLNLLGLAARQNVVAGEDQTGPVPFLEVLASWCEAVTDERSLKPVRCHVVAMTARLTAHLGWICEQEWVVDFEAEIRELLKTVQSITRTEPRRVPLPGVMCPSCRMLSLVWGTTAGGRRSASTAPR